MKLFFVRHGQTDMNTRGLDGVWGSDDPLNSTGRSQAQAAAATLKNLVSHDVRLLSSPLLRTRQTAEIIADTLSVSVAVADELRETGVGKWDGQTFRESFVAWERVPFDQKSEFRPPGGESWLDIAGRMRALIQSLEDDGANEAILVSHSGPIRFAVVSLLGSDPLTWGDDGEFYDNGSITILACRDGIWTIEE